MVLFRITENEPSKMHNVRPYVYSRPCTHLYTFIHIYTHLHYTAITIPQGNITVRCLYAQGHLDNTTLNIHLGI